LFSVRTMTFDRKVNSEHTYSLITLNTSMYPPVSWYTYLYAVWLRHIAPIGINPGCTLTASSAAYVVSADVSKRTRVVALDLEPHILLAPTYVCDGDRRIRIRFLEHSGDARHQRPQQFWPRDRQEVFEVRPTNSRASRAK